MTRFNKCRSLCAREIKESRTCSRKLKNSETRWLIVVRLCKSNNQLTGFVYE